MTTIKAEPEELRRLATTVRQSGTRLRQLGDQAIAAAASAAQSPAAAGTIAEAASFAAGAHLTELEAGLIAADTERVAALFEAADRGAGWFERASLVLIGGTSRVALGLYGTATGLRDLCKNVPHDLRRSSWSAWQKKLRDARTNVGRLFGDRGVLNTVKAMGKAQWRILSDPRKAAVKFVNQGVRSVTGLAKHTSFLNKVAPLAKFTDRIVGKVVKPLMVIQSFHDSKAPNAAGKVTSAVVSTALTTHPVGFVLDLATGGQVTKATDGVVNTIFSAGDSERLNAMSQANASGENGAVMQAIEFVGDDLIAEGLYNGWNWIANGH